MTQQKRDIEQRLSRLSPEKRKLFERLLKEESARRPAIERRPAEGPVPLSFAQQRLWFLHQLEPDSIAYNLPAVKVFTGPLDVSALRRALGELVDRHEVLRTKYVNVDGVPYQFVCAAEPFPLPIDDLSGFDPEARSAESRRLIAATISERFDLAAGCPLRGRLLKMDDADHLLVLAIHHIVYDMWSGGIFWSELDTLITAFAAGGPSPLPPLPIQYHDFARWQRETLTDEALAADLAYWRSQLAGAPSVLPLPADRPRPPVMSGRGGMDWLTVPADTAGRLRSIARREQATMFMMLVAGFHTVLHWYSASDDVVLGSPIANRKPEETESLMGIFLNNLVLRADLSGDPPFTEVLARVRRTVLDAFAHGDIPFEKLVEALHPERVLNVHPLFQVLFTLQSTTRRDVALPAATADTLPSVSVAMDLEAYFDDTGEAIGGLFKYSTDLFEPATIGRMSAQFGSLLAAVAENPARPLSELREIAQSGERHLWQAWNATAVAVPEPHLVHRLFESQAETRPSADALLVRGERVSYATLDSMADHVAGHLRAAGVGPESRVGVYMERSAELVAAVLGVLKAGAAYLPLDPAFPRERIAFMLADSEAAAVLTDRPSQQTLPPCDARVLVVDDLSDAPASEPAAMSAENPAYVIYTSGSTGRPKGVVVPHRAVANLLEAMRRRPGLEAEDRLLAVTTLSFDIAGLELFLPLTTGATVVLASRDDAVDPRRLMALLGSSKASVMQATPATWRMLIEAGWQGEPSLKALCGGEALSEELARELAGRVGELWNMYGPTETTIWSTVARVEPGEPITIGGPIANTQIHLLDRALQPVPIGAIGEICIAGVGVARGYWRRPELTAERFIPDPQGAEGSRLYRTGDLGRFRSDGRIECLGRIDHQVKLRGFRIELGEIESVLVAHPAVSQAVARIREDLPGHPRLVAYIVADGVPGDLMEALKARIAQSLPQYMHPSAYVKLDALPLTPNGKIDRAALPAPERPEGSHAIREPSSVLEREIAQVWTDVLKVPGIGVDENFFDHGGHSLLLVQVQSRLAAAGHQVAILDLFQYPTIAALARHLSGEGVVERFAEQAAARVGTNDEAGSAHAVAIVGLAGRFPGSADVDGFWQSLRDGIEGIRFFSDEELKAAGIPEHQLKQPTYVKARGALEGADLFDAPLFGFTPREAALMDPQHRLFLECAWEALDRSGYDPQTYPGAIGVFGGSSLSVYVMQALAQGSHGLGPADLDVLLNADKDHLPTRVSYKLNLRGPSVTVQTACSTSLVAVHMACQSLLRGECDMALAGGVSVGMTQVGGYTYLQGSILSPDGHCRPFDASAGGTVGGNGVGIVVLKRLPDAIRDGDHLHAVVRGTAINNDGSGKIGYTAPSIEGQSRVIAAAQAAAGCTADSIGYVEAHGTGTSLGDPIEVKALTQVFKESTTRCGYCAIGSVKSNIGHLDAAAGVAGLIKATLALERCEIPPTLHFNTPNPEIDFRASPFFVNTELRPWVSANGAPRRAAVSSFGLGGTNAHAILEEAPALESSGPSRRWQVLPISARTESALESAVDRLATHLERHPALSLADVAFTLSVGRQNLEHRRAIVCRGIADAVEALRGKAAGPVIAGRATGRRRVAFLFPGQGSQYVAMGSALHASEDVFRREFDRCATLFAAASAIDLRVAIDADEEGPIDRWSTGLTQAALFATEYALARLWMSWGVQPSAMIGHSIGEYVAAAIAGVLTLEDAVALVATRSQLMEAAPAGAMLAVAAGEEQLRGYLDGEVSLAAHNGPTQYVLSGGRPAIDRLEARLSAAGLDSRRLHTAGAFHSTMMEGVVAPLTDAARRVKPGEIGVPYVSNVSGTWISDADVRDPSYWGRHARSTVRFHRGAQTLLESGIDLCIEVGPGQTLAGLVRPVAAGSNHAVTFVGSLPRHDGTRDEPRHIARSLAEVWTAGLRPAWESYFAGERRRRVVLPAYSFERKRHWLEPVAAGATPRALGRAKDPDVGNWFFTPEWQSLPAVPFDAQAVVAAGPWMVLGESTGVGALVAVELRTAGADVVLVCPGDRFDRTPDGFTVTPTASDFAALISELRDARRLPRAVVHAWGTATGEGADPTIERAFGGLMLLARGAGEVGVQFPALAVTLTTGVHRVLGTEAIACEAATALGPALVLPTEQEGVTSRAIDLVAAEWSTADCARTRALIAAFMDPLAPTLGAFRNGRRWRRRFHQQPLAVPARPHVKRGGVYLITGGYGGVGLELATYLVEACGDTRLVLTGRTGLPDRHVWPTLDDSSDAQLKQRVAAVKALESRGAEVLVFAADVTDAAAMQRAVTAAIERFGTIDGVIHAAGLPGARVMQLDDGEESARVLAPKVAGTQVLLDALARAGVRPDLVVLCSSINTAAGAIGQSAYTAANAYLDAVAHAAPAAATRVIAINWDAWQEAGMAVNTTLPERLARLRREELKNGILNAEGRDAFGRILAQGIGPQVFVSTRDLRADAMPAARPVAAPAPSEAPAADERAALSSPYVAPRNPIEADVAEVWRQLFGVSAIGVDDHFFELGGHSLLATQIMSRVRERFQVDLGIAALFEEPTVAGLAVRVMEQLMAAEASATEPS